MEKFIHTSENAGKKFFMEFSGKGKVVMLNLLKFKARADYSKDEHLKPVADISGKEAYQLYMKSIRNVFEGAGSKMLFFGESFDFLIGPQDEKWDAVLLAEHQSASKFIEFAKNQEYLKYAGHRTAALEDSRLLPISAI